MTLTAVGLDPSLTSTGLAYLSATDEPGIPGATLAITPKKVTGLERLRSIGDAVEATLEAWSPDVVVVERFVRAAAQAGVHERGGLWWRLVDLVDAAGYPVVLVTPSALKLYATGKGNAGKPAVVLAAARRFEWFAGEVDDEADALWLAAAGLDLLGSPIVVMPAHNRTALDSAEAPYRRIGLRRP